MLSRSNFSAAVIDNKMFTFGGFHDGQTLRSVECFDHEAPGGPLWCNLQPMKIPKSAMGVTVIPTYICPYSYVEYLGLYGDDVVPQEVRYLRTDVWHSQTSIFNVFNIYL
jgi:hypothetical protein